MLKLLQVNGLDSDYNHSVNFFSQSTQLSYFFSKCLFTFEDMDYLRKNNNIQIELPIKKIKYCNYLICRNENDERYYFYFIMDYKYINEDVTEIIIKLDVLQTYLFDITNYSGTLERKHFTRGELLNFNNLENENINVGELEISNRFEVYNYENLGGYIVTSSQRLGVSSSEGRPNGGTGGDNGNDGDNSCGDWNNGVISSNGFRFLKGYEGFGKYKYYDSGGIETIGYGITRSELDIFNELVSKQPITEQLASEKMYNLINVDYGKKIIDKLKRIGIKQQNRFDALLSVAYNGGIGLINGTNQNGGMDLINAIERNPSDENYIRPIWENFFVKDNNGVVQEGLKLRRIAECNIYFNDKYEFRKIVTINSDGSYGDYITENNGNGWLPTCENNLPISKKIINELGEFMCPTTGTVTALYPSYPSGGYHNGNDIANDLNTPIYSMTDGKVVISGEVSGFGHAIYVESNINGKNVRIRYGHMYKNGLLVKVGDNVKVGQKIALMGNDGQSTGSHLHFDFYVNGNFINPSNNLKVGEIIK